MPGVFIASRLGPEYSGFDGLAGTLLGLGIVATVLWLILFAVRWFTSFPRLPEAGPATQELPGEPPAVTNFLVHRWKTTHTAVSATILDLAARKFLAIEDYMGNIVVRVHPERGQGGLLPFEDQTLQLVRNQVQGRSAPIETLSLGGSKEQAEAWWKRFERGVMDEARKRGLARVRWSRNDWYLIGGGLAVPFLFFGLALMAAHVSIGDENDDPIAGSDWLITAGIGWAVIMFGLSQVRNLRDTPAGRAACAAWLGVAKYYQQVGTFRELGPAAVVVWERHMSYAAAMGLAHEAVEKIQLFPEDPEEAWVRHRGEWRELRIEYPTRFNFGRKPVNVFFEGLLLTAVFGGILFVMLPFLTALAFDIIPDVADDFEIQVDAAWQLWLLAAGVGGALAFGIGHLVVRFIDGAAKLILGLLDLGRWKQVEGEIVKIHNDRFAVFEGNDEKELKAWYRPPKATPIRRHARVRVTLSPHLNYVREVEMLPETPAGSGMRSTVAPTPVTAEPAQGSASGLG